jgi:homogentisate 1,2-dioxygenase
MPIYHQLGRVPRKRHIAFRNQDGSLLPEELIGNHGFTGPASLVYHLREPTRITNVRRLRRVGWKAEADRLLRHRHFRTTQLKPGPSIVFDRVPLLFNAPWPSRWRVRRRTTKCSTGTRRATRSCT